jgi:hypothetical protein
VFTTRVCTWPGSQGVRTSGAAAVAIVDPGEQRGQHAAPARTGFVNRAPWFDIAGTRYELGPGDSCSSSGISRTTGRTRRPNRHRGVRP